MGSMQELCGKRNFYFGDNCSQLLDAYGEKCNQWRDQTSSKVLIKNRKVEEAILVLLDVSLFRNIDHTSKMSRPTFVKQLVHSLANGSMAYVKQLVHSPA